MTAPAVTTTPAATTGQAARIMSRRIRRLPVRDPLTGRLAGIVTRSDLLRVYLRPRDQIRADIEATVFRCTAPGDSHPAGRGRDPGR